ncbi:hypothetical protein Emtol_3745 [Emticicia oligotrophica DSM 17448]|uniref:Uncharacterized protein n=1 Tax=Emticicia oligotrophica (strain DSM 17448 / CIP 109782 / MTCC 6937 / GPTSA100-15) TaxID=929562 RepID=A0ABN4ASA4_EMTOG|nr:hypothetical protein [Emticicia oligotrophica]AFK04871.1 hypothetical protein Emtol_3745 [Emticicia oligotrophica DSM 17448]
MKNAIFRILNVFMAVVVLISNTGFGLIEHSCTVKGKQTALYKSETSCCNKSFKNHTSSERPVVKKSKCCSEEEKYQNVDYSYSASESVAKFVQKSIDWVKVTITDFLRAVVRDILENLVSKKTSSSPPSSNGISIRIFIQSFLI